MEDKERQLFAIPANYTDSGRLLGGMLEVRNTVEAVFLVGLIGYPEIAWLNVETTTLVVIMTVTLLPVGIVALMGVGGDSLLQYTGHMIRHWTRKRKLHYRRIGYGYKATAKDRKKKKAARSKKAKA